MDELDNILNQVEGDAVDFLPDLAGLAAGAIGDHGGGENEQQEAPAGESGDPSERLFVTKIPREIDEYQLREYFESFGKVTDLHVPKIPGRDGHKGIAFLSYEDGICAQIVKEQGRHFIGEHQVIVDSATPRNPALSASRKDEHLKGKKGGKGKGKGGGWGNDSWGGGKGGGWGNDSWGGGKGGGGKSWGGGGGGGRNSDGSHESNRVFVTKIGPGISKANLMEYFQQFGELEDCYVPAATHPGMPHKGIAFVSFINAKIAEEVLRRESYEVKPGQFVVVDKANMRGGGGGGGGGGRFQPY